MVVWHQTPAYRPHMPWPAEYSMFTYGIRHLLTDHTCHGPLNTARLRMVVWHQTPAYRPHMPWPAEYRTFTYGIRHLLTDHTRHGPLNTARLRMVSDTCLRTTHSRHNTHGCHFMGYSFSLAARYLLYAPYTHNSITTSFVTPVVEHWLGKAIFNIICGLSSLFIIFLPYKHSFCSGLQVQPYHII